MRQVKTSARSWVFALSLRERAFFIAVLQAYPAVPQSHQPLSRESADRLSPEDEHLLHEALAQHRKENQAKVRRWLKGGARFKRVEEEFHFSLARTDYNWMLQVLNDVRVGNWIALGSPEEIHNPVELLQRDAAAFFHMEAAGMFQMELLQLINGTSTPG